MLKNRNFEPYDATFGTLVSQNGVPERPTGDKSDPKASIWESMLDVFFVTFSSQIPDGVPRAPWAPFGVQK